MNSEVKIRASLGAFAMLLGAAIVCGLMHNAQLRSVPIFEMRLQRPAERRIEKFPEPEIPIGAPGFTPLDEKKQGLFDRIRANRQVHRYRTYPQPICSSDGTATIRSSETITSQRPMTTVVSQTSSASGNAEPRPLGESKVSQGVMQESCIPCQPQYRNTPPAFQPHWYAQYQPNYAPTNPSLHQADVFTRPTDKKYKLALFLDDSPKSSTVLNWFGSNANLVKLKAASDVQVYSPNDTLYVTRHQALVPRNTFPAVFVLDQRGGQIYAAGGADIPSNPDTMWADIYKGKMNYDSVQQGMINRILAQQPWPASFTTQYDPLPKFDASQDPDCPDGNCPIDPSGVDAFDRLRPPVKPAIDLAVLSVEEMACLVAIAVAGFCVWTQFRKT